MHNSPSPEGEEEIAIRLRKTQPPQEINHSHQSEGGRPTSVRETTLVEMEDRPPHKFENATRVKIAEALPNPNR